MPTKREDTQLTALFAGVPGAMTLHAVEVAAPGNLIVAKDCPGELRCGPNGVIVRVYIGSCQIPDRPTGLLTKRNCWRVRGLTLEGSRFTVGPVIPPGVTITEPSKQRWLDFHPNRFVLLNQRRDHVNFESSAKWPKSSEISVDCFVDRHKLPTGLAIASSASEPGESGVLTLDGWTVRLSMKDEILCISLPSISGNSALKRNQRLSAVLHGIAAISGIPVRAQVSRLRGGINEWFDCYYFQIKSSNNFNTRILPQLSLCDSSLCKNVLECLINFYTCPKYGYEAAKALHLVLSGAGSPDGRSLLSSVCLISLAKIHCRLSAGKTEQLRGHDNRTITDAGLAAGVEEPIWAMVLEAWKRQRHSLAHGGLTSEDVESPEALIDHGLIRSGCNVLLLSLAGYTGSGEIFERKAITVQIKPASGSKHN